MPEKYVCVCVCVSKEWANGRHQYCAVCSLLFHSVKSSSLSDKGSDTFNMAALVSPKRVYVKMSIQFNTNYLL